MGYGIPCRALEGLKGEYPSPVPAIAVFPAYHRLGSVTHIPSPRFFDAMGYSHGELTHYANIARDCGVDAKTVKESYQILVDTLLGRMIEPFKKRQEPLDSDERLRLQRIVIGDDRFVKLGFRKE